MTRRDNAPPAGPSASAQRSPTRRRLIALLSGLSVIGREVVGTEQPSPCAVSFDPVADPMPQLFGAFQALLKQHEAALANCDRIEAALLAQMDYPRVSLPPDWDGSRRYAADALSIAQEGLPARHQRRLERLRQRRQRRWDAAAHAAGLTAAQTHETALDTANGLLATPVWTLDAVVLKLLVLLSTHEPGLVACETSPWRELRLILMDLRGLAANSGAHP